MSTTSHANEEYEIAISNMRARIERHLSVRWSIRSRARFTAEKRAQARRIVQRLNGMIERETHSISFLSRIMAGGQP